jgi:hypothetical protein
MEGKRERFEIGEKKNQSPFSLSHLLRVGALTNDLLVQDTLSIHRLQRKRGMYKQFFPFLYMRAAKAVDSTLSSFLCPHFQQVFRSSGTQNENTSLSKRLSFI